MAVLCKVWNSKLWFEVSGSEESGNVGGPIENYKRIGSMMSLWESMSKFGSGE